ncbi:DUF732 domain-containing protein [Mycobacterium xenopi]|uniref:DUF732 domain-containing protein n=1 Tax=Mycobacterium xenopi TaxID=1789 RepID=A0AAD1M2C0_MYCXE|nr:DUF732 domain-containing protein [Mycobacterium xenopi]EID17011.1 hypothetical protein MXEN_02494 [Mycobacterium xenopi RIVM700367]MDA3640985.1 DUF732 domain-containing protein [Mycobacterium xenopi]MDA3660081.1 DUF732 domain-containing protein [Mycobacterium xenopi]MDA3662834.1 DUF732 domain-containing protein [Mycobacterium xenopi]ORX14104.1 hypothetical protein AWC32_14485 [Mycobacterium xenopi]
MRRVRIALTWVGLVVAAGAVAAPVQANSVDEQFLSALNNSGVNYGDPGAAVTLGQSVCPMLAQPGGTFASAASGITGQNGMSPAMAQMFTSIAISMYCPSMMASIANGNLPNLPQLPGMPGI